MLSILLFSGDSCHCLVVLYLFLRLFEPHILLTPKCFILVSFVYVFLPRDSIFQDGWVFERLQQEKHIGQSMSYFYPLEVSLNKAHRNLLRKGVMHMGPCPPMQVHFTR